MTVPSPFPLSEEVIERAQKVRQDAIDAALSGRPKHNMFRRIREADLAGDAAYASVIAAEVWRLAREECAKAAEEVYAGSNCHPLYLNAASTIAARIRALAPPPARKQPKEEKS